MAKMRLVLLLVAFRGAEGMSHARVEAVLATDATPLPAAASDEQAMAFFAEHGVTKVPGVLDAATCERLRARIVDGYDVTATDEPADRRYSSRSRVRFGDCLRVGFAGSRSDVLLPYEDSAVGGAVRTAARRLRDVLTHGVGLLERDAGEQAPGIELVECGSLVARLGAGHQSLHRDYTSGLADPESRLPPRVVVFVALQRIEAKDCGATVFKSNAGGAPWCSTPLEAGDAVVYSASTEHFGASKAVGKEARAILYFSMANAASPEDRAQWDDESQKLLGAVAANFDAVAPPTLEEICARDTLTDLADGGSLEKLLFRDVAVADDGFGGLGVFATTRVEPGTEIARVPFDRCVFPDAAAAFVGKRLRADVVVPDDAQGAESGDFLREYSAEQFLTMSKDSIEAQGVVVAAAIAKVRYGDASQESHDEATFRGKWQSYVDSLPWGDDETRSDSLRVHPLVLAMEQADGELEEDLAAALLAARRGSGLVRSLLGPAIGDAACFRAVLIVLTRAFDLSHVRPGATIALMPAGDLFNHPSAALVVGTAFAECNMRGACVQSVKAPGADAISIRAPVELDLFPGDQIYNYYGAAGFGADSPEDWRKSERAFLHQYGFVPW